ncbi:hypothetical protein [Lacibacter sp.]|uniref:hypothetical protein n=1 Tax=Lacibacter sp. TaxID=1915409 RepID=UPI002B4B36E1|nr:hypothetical protein [Lacibacter sp.]HLP39464.1 hypothetical protein [Lacibacter sp.]
MFIDKKNKSRAIKLYIPGFLIIPVCFLFSCTGPRNIYSASPLVSPVPMQKGSTAIEANYFSHTRQENVKDSVPGNSDNCFGLTLSYMLKERTLVFVYADVKKERNQFALKPRPVIDFDYNAYNAGFDSSIVFGRRYTMGTGVEFFSDVYKPIIGSLAIVANFHQFNMKEAGILLQAPYQRYYRLNQLTFSLQGNLLLKAGDRFNLAVMGRITILNSFKASTDYSHNEKKNAGLLDQRVKAFLSLPNLNAEYKPFKRFPLFITGQFFNEFTAWRFVSYEPGRIYLKGTGASVGMKYIFN